jgi:hypothetical protein
MLCDARQIERIPRIQLFEQLCSEEKRERVQLTRKSVAARRAPLR